MTNTRKSGYRDAMLKKIGSHKAVSEVIGVVLLLAITVSLFAILNFYVFHFSFGTSVPSVDLIGTIDKANKTIYIEHNGGESLEGNMNIIITIGSTVYQNTSNELLLDVNADNKWNFCEVVRFDSPESLTDKYIRVMVVDPTANAILLSVVLQKG